MDDPIKKTVHDLCNILMVISGNAQLCLLEDLQNEEVIKNLKIIIEQAERAKKIVEEIALTAKEKASPEKV